MDLKICAWCKQEFKPVRSWHRYCRAFCRWKAWDKRHPRLKQLTTAKRKGDSPCNRAESKSTAT